MFSHYSPEHSSLKKLFTEAFQSSFGPVTNVMYVSEFFTMYVYFSLKDLIADPVTDFKGRSKSCKPHPESVGETREFFTVFQYRCLSIAITSRKKVASWSCKNCSTANVILLLFPKWRPRRLYFNLGNREKSHVGW